MSAVRPRLSIEQDCGYVVEPVGRIGRRWPRLGRADAASTLVTSCTWVCSLRTGDALMRKKIVFMSVTLAAVALGVSTARAWFVFDTLREAVESLRPVRPVAETGALAPLVGTFRLDGSIPRRVLAKDQDEMRSSGMHSGRWILNNNFVEVDLSDTATIGGQSVSWSGHVILGYDHQDKLYRGAIADSQGTLGMVEGRMANKKLLLTLVTNNTIASRPFKYRIAFDMTNPNAIKFTSEVQDRENWVLTEQKTLTRVGAISAP
jgi:Protein of unknown function (DUF1579)